jgi:DNA polymerase-4
VQGDAYRLIGIGISDFAPAVYADPLDLSNPNSGRVKVLEKTIDNVRARFGDNAIKKGRSFNSGGIDATSR